MRVPPVFHLSSASVAYLSSASTIAYLSSFRCPTAYLPSAPTAYLPSVSTIAFASLCIYANPLPPDDEDSETDGLGDLPRSGLGPPAM